MRRRSPRKRRIRAQGPPERGIAPAGGGGRQLFTHRTRFGYPHHSQLSAQKEIWRFNGPYNDNVQREREENPHVTTTTCLRKICI